MHIRQFLAPIAAAPVLAPVAPRVGSLRIHDAKLMVWEEDVNETEFQRVVFGPMIRFLRDRGWTLGADPQTRKHYRILSPRTRSGCCGDLKAHIRLSGRSIEVELWQDVANITHVNGGRYEFNKMEKMPNRLRLQCIATLRALAGFLRQRHGYTLDLPEIGARDLSAAGIDTEAWVMERLTKSGHYKPELGRAEWWGDYNRKSGDGVLLEHGQPVWFRDDAQRWARGRAFYDLNNNWIVIVGRASVAWVSAHNLFANRPVNLRGRSNPWKRRKRLEQELQKAIARMDFRRAAALREVMDRILFSGAPLYRIWSDKQDAWYATNAEGYASDASRAGLYTEAEARDRIGGMDFLRGVPVTPGLAAITASCPCKAQAVSHG